VDLGLRAKLEVGAPKDTFLQFNVVNVFNKFYTGGFDGARRPIMPAPTTPTWPRRAPSPARLGGF
jgi:hypothetical protein